MVTEPRLLFLDEPTSGLDSYSAYNTVAQLKQLAQEKGATVVCTIHQPSSEVFALFDRVLILKAGRVVYADTVAGMNDWFASRGFPIPPNYNPDDHAMFVVQKTTVKELEAANMFQPPPSTASTLADTVGMSSERAEQEVLPPTQSTFTEQLSWLLHREMKRVVRDKPALIGRFGVTIFLNTLFGLLFYGAGSGDDSDPQKFQDHFGALVMVAISSMFGGAQPALLAFPVERPIFLRENVLVNCVLLLQAERRASDVIHADARGVDCDVLADWISGQLHLAGAIFVRARCRGNVRGHLHRLRDSRRQAGDGGDAGGVRSSDAVRWLLRSH